MKSEGERSRQEHLGKPQKSVPDLEGAQSIEMHHVAEAINYRAFDRKLFG